MEMSVSFTDGTIDLNLADDDHSIRTKADPGTADKTALHTDALDAAPGIPDDTALHPDSQPASLDGDRYVLDETVLGRVWIPAEGVELKPPVRVRYEKYPWMEKFELDGVKVLPARRKGVGNKSAKGFVKSLNTIYSKAYDDYFELGGDLAFDAHAYFARSTEYFAVLAESGLAGKMVKKYCGFVENMWREGTEEMLDVCMRTVISGLRNSEAARAIFEQSITEEFAEYIREHE